MELPEKVKGGSGEGFKEALKRGLRRCLEQAQREHSKEVTRAKGGKYDLL